MKSTLDVFTPNIAEMAVIWESIEIIWPLQFLLGDCEELKQLVRHATCCMMCSIDIPHHMPLLGPLDYLLVRTIAA